MDRGEYQLVLAAPEDLVDPLGHFQHHTIRNSTPFFRYLVAVAIDECHLMWSWEDFRVDFQKIGDLKNNLYHIPFVCLSATLTPNVQAYVHKVCKLKDKTIFFNLSTRRDNINIAVIPTINDTTYQPLIDLIPENIRDPHEIPKTLIFVDDINMAKSIADTLRAKLPSLLQNKPPEVLIRTYWASIDDAKKTRTYNNIRNGTARIAVCTDAFGLGINIPDIERVIQWGVTPRLSLDRLYQRLGRAARGRPEPGGPPRIGYGFIYVNKSILQAVPSQWNAAGSSDDDGGECAEESPEVELDDPFMLVPVPRRVLSKFALPVNRDTARTVRAHLLGLYRSELDAKAAHREAKNSQVGTVQEKMSAVEKVDPAVLWVIATTGCRHAAILSVFQDPERWQTGHQSWCCDVCAFRNGIDRKEFHSGVALEATVAYLRADRDNDKIILLDRLINVLQLDPQYNETRSGDITKAHKEFVDKVIQRWRLKKLEDLALPPSILPCTVLPDKVVWHLTANLKRIVNEQQLFRAFKQLHYDVDSSMLTRRDLRNLLSLIR